MFRLRQEKMDEEVRKMADQQYRVSRNFLRSARTRVKKVLGRASCWTGWRWT